MICKYPQMMDNFRAQLYFSVAESCQSATTVLADATEKRGTVRSRGVMMRERMSGTRSRDGAAFRVRMGLGVKMKMKKCRG